MEVEESACTLVGDGVGDGAHVGQAGRSGGAEWDELAVGAAALARRALDPDTAAPALAGDAMHAAAHGLTWLACGLADRAPTLLVVDDVHWAFITRGTVETHLTHVFQKLGVGNRTELASLLPAHTAES